MDHGGRPIRSEIEWPGQVAGEPVGAKRDVARRLAAERDDWPTHCDQLLNHATTNLAARPQDEDRTAIHRGRWIHAASTIHWRKSSATPATATYIFLLRP